MPAPEAALHIPPTHRTSLKCAKAPSRPHLWAACHCCLLPRRPPRNAPQGPPGQGGEVGRQAHARSPGPGYQKGHSGQPQRSIHASQPTTTAPQVEPKQHPAHGSQPTTMAPQLESTAQLPTCAMWAPSAAPSPAASASPPSPAAVSPPAPVGSLVEGPRHCSSGSSSTAEAEVQLCQRCLHVMRLHPSDVPSSSAAATPFDNVICHAAHRPPTSPPRSVKPWQAPIANNTST